MIWSSRRARSMQAPRRCHPALTATGASASAVIAAHSDWSPRPGNWGVNKLARRPGRRRLRASRASAISMPRADWRRRRTTSALHIDASHSVGVDAQSAAVRARGTMTTTGWRAVAATSVAVRVVYGRLLSALPGSRRGAWFFHDDIASKVPALSPALAQFCDVPVEAANAAAHGSARFCWCRSGRSGAIRGLDFHGDRQFRP